MKRNSRLLAIFKRVLFQKKYVRKKLLKIISPLLSDQMYLKLIFPLNTGYKLNLERPTSFNEKMQWLKLNDRKPVYVKMVDKYEAKRYVASIIGDNYIIPTLAVYNTVEEIDFNALPNQFVLKCTHDSGGIVICKDKSSLDVKHAQWILRKGLKTNYFYQNREWPYKNVKPRIIAEQYMKDESGWQLKDYKIFCFNGEPKFIEVDYDRYVDHKLNVYDLNWNFIDFYMTSPNDKNVNIKKPAKLEEMLDIAKKLSVGLKFVRVDLYSINENIYFGELTHYPGSGFIDFHPKEYDKKLGEMLSLTNL